MTNSDGYSTRELPSKTSVRRAGSTIRRLIRDEAPTTDAESELLVAAVELVSAYRSFYSEPMDRVNRGLRELCSQTGLEAQVSSRLKRLPTIVDKLCRPDNSDLSRMEDIGGCRIVASSYSDLQSIRHVVEEHYGSHVSRVRNYISEPRPSGYRSLHVIISEPESQLKIEVQLRTRLMHDWAELVEAFNSMFGENFKNEGEHPVHEFMKIQSKQFAYDENLGSALSVAEVDKLRTLASEVQRLLRSLAPRPERNS